MFVGAIAWWSPLVAGLSRCLSSGSDSLYCTRRSSPQSEFLIAHKNTPTAPFRFKNVIFRHHYVTQKNISSIGTEQSYLCRVLHFNRQILMLISPLNDKAADCDICWKYLTEH